MAFNEDVSFIEYPVDQPTQDFVTNFDTIGGTTDVVLVTVDGVLTDTPESSYTVQQINHTTWRVTPEVQTGSVVRLYRVTNIDEMMHVFTAGAKFIARNMDNNFKQIRHAQQEVRDAFDFLEYNTLGVVEAAKAATAAANDATELSNATTAEFQNAINTIVVNDGVPAVAVLDASGVTQQDVNDLTGAPYRTRVSGYNIGERVVLENGDIVKNTVAGNTNDPNVDMTGWVSEKSNWVFVEDFGARPSPFDSTSAFNDALLSSRRVMTKSGVKYKITATINLAQERNALFLGAGTEIESTLTDTTLFNLSGQSSKVLSFGGKITSPELHIGTQGTPTYGVVQLNANNCEVAGIDFLNYYRFAIQIKDTAGHSIHGNTFNGNVPYVFYNESNSNTLSRGAISFDNPPNTNLNPSLNIFDNKFLNDVQGIMCGNFGSVAATGGVKVQGNHFYNMYDHALYFDGVSSDFSIIIGNTYIDCRRPIVGGGKGAVITNNTFKGVTNSKFFEQYISLRDPIDCVVMGNTFNGFGAGISLQHIIGTEISGNIISGNTFNQTAASSFNSVVRVYNADKVENNTISNNIIKGYPAKLFGSIFIDAATVGENNRIEGNTIYCYADSYVAYLKNQSGCSFKNNTLILEYDAPAAVTMIMLNLLGVVKSDLSGNIFRCTKLGSNVTLRAASSELTSTNNTVFNNTFDLSAPNLVGKSTLFNFAASNKLRNNVLDLNADMAGSFSLGLVNSTTVSNANILASSNIIIQPKNSAAALLMAGQGFYLTVASGQFTFLIPGSAPTSATEWSYIIL